MPGRPTSPISIFVCLVAFMASAALAGVEPTNAAPNSHPVYQQLRNAGLSGEAVTVSNLDLKRDIGTFHLRSGTVCFLNEGSEKRSGLGTQDVFQNTKFEVLFQLMAGRVLTVFQYARIATARGSSASFFKLIVGAVRKAQHKLGEIFAELVFAGEQLQHAALGCRRGVDDEVAVAHENCASHFALSGG
jgi:hypothetical protein